MAFLPKGAEAPKERGNYLKPIEGTINFRAVSDMIYGYEYWTDESKEQDGKSKPVRLREFPKERPENVRIEKDGTSYRINHFWAFKVIDREHPDTVKILEITQNSIKRDIESLLQDQDWGEPFNYDIKITGEGKGLERKYTVIPVPHKPLTAGEKSMVERTEINLEALFYGENPFDKNWEAPADMPVEIKAEDVPF